jgi:hypothetical protein
MFNQQYKQQLAARDDPQADWFNMTLNRANLIKTVNNKQAHQKFDFLSDST